MYWNNSWVSPFNRKNFLNKTIFFENIFLFLFSDKLFNFFFTHKLTRFKSTKIFKVMYIGKRQPQPKLYDNFSYSRVQKKKKTKTKYNFTKVWFVRYNNFILLSTFVFFYFKIKKKKTLKIKHLLKKKPNIFWRKKRGVNLKKKKFSNLDHLLF